MGCGQSSAQQKAQPEVSTADHAKPAGTADAAVKQELRVGDRVSVSKDGGLEGEVVKYTTTEVKIRGADGKEHWCEREDVRIKTVGSSPPLEKEVQVGQVVSTAQGIKGTVTKRTTTDVYLRKEDGQEARVGIEDITYLEVCVRGDVGLRDADVAAKSDLYCVVQLEGKPHTKVTTPVASDEPSPMWNFVSYAPGDALAVEVYSRDDANKVDVACGRARLAGEQIEGDGFFGDLQLEETGKPCKGFLNLQVHVKNPEVKAAQPEDEPQTRDDLVAEVSQAPRQSGWCC